MSDLLTWLSTNFRYFGMAGSAMVLITVIIAAIRYRGKAGEKYSMLNHFISELGEVGVSSAAAVFNLGLILGGLFLLPFLAGLGLALEGIWAKLALVAGVWAALSCSAVGIFPMNNLEPHTRAAMSYFRSGLVMVLLFMLAFLTQPAEKVLVSPAVGLFSLLAICSYGSFLALPRVKDLGGEASNDLDPLKVKKRPRFWLLPTLEWAVLISTMLWLFGVALLVRSG